MSNAKIVPDDFKKIMKDFYSDVLTSFPEYKDKLSSDVISFLTNDDEPVDLFYYCVNIYPERFFDFKNTIFLLRVK